MADSSLNFVDNGLYLLLSDLGDLHTFHWGLYLAKSPSEGTVFHLVDTDNSTAWELEVKSSTTIITSIRLILALKLEDLEPPLHTALKDRLSKIPIIYSTRFKENMTCRIWVKEALYALNDEGFISLTKEVGTIAMESIGQAMLLKNQNKKSIVMDL